jgi:L-aspartate-alpha-decarboxylase
MQVTLMKGKIHRAHVTEADLHYEGSISIDRDLIEAAGLLINERVDIYNIDNGARFSTYVIEAPAGSGTIGLNGAAARQAMVGDKVLLLPTPISTAMKLGNFNRAWCSSMSGIAGFDSCFFLYWLRAGPVGHESHLRATWRAGDASHHFSTHGRSTTSNAHVDRCWRCSCKYVSAIWSGSAMLSSTVVPASRCARVPFS